MLFHFRWFMRDVWPTLIKKNDGKNSAEITSKCLCCSLEPRGVQHEVRFTREPSLGRGARPSSLGDSMPLHSACDQASSGRKKQARGLVGYTPPAIGFPAGTPPSRPPAASESIRSRFRLSANTWRERRPERDNLRRRTDPEERLASCSSSWALCGAMVALSGQKGLGWSRQDWHALKGLTGQLRGTALLGSAAGQPEPFVWDRSRMRSGE